MKQVFGMSASSPGKGNYFKLKSLSAKDARRFLVI